MVRPSAAVVAVLALAAAAGAADLPAQTTFINIQIAAKWKEADIKRPAGRATDAEYLRRVFIDILGRIASPEEFADFEADKSSDKRQKLVKRLLYATDHKPRVNGAVVKVDAKTVLTFNYADEYAERWADIWTVWLMSRSTDARYRDQMRVWLETELLKEDFNYKEMVGQILTATGRTDGNGAVNFIAQQLGEANPPDKRRELGPFDAVPVTSRVTRLFLGLQTQCTQCHDHPFNKEWVQADFWGVNAFFRQVTRSGTPNRPADAANGRMMGGLTQVELGDNPAVNSDARIYYERRDGQLKSIRPTFLKDMAQADKGEKSDKVPAGGKSRREALAEFVVSHDNFAKAYVNRIWGHLFGRGLNKDAAVDDFGSHNEVVHPELLDKLAADFAQYGYKPKLLVEWVCASEAYNLSHVAAKESADPKFDPYFARMPLKALPPEVLFASISIAAKADAAKGGDAKARAEGRDRWMAKLVKQFGDDEGNEMTFNGTIVQALLMMNGRELNEEVGAKGANAVARVLAKHSKSGSVNVDGVLDDLFIMTLNRHITPDEKVKLKGVQQRGAVLKAEAPKPSVPPAKGAKPVKPAPKPPAVAGVVPPTYLTDVTFYQDVFWALLNTNEFMLNH